MKRIRKNKLSYIMVFLVAICLTLVPIQAKASTNDNIVTVLPEVKDGVVKVTGTTGTDVVAVLVEIFDTDNKLVTMETHKAADGKYEATIDATLTEGATYLFYVANFNGKGNTASVEYQVPKKNDTNPDSKPETKPDEETTSESNTDEENNPQTDSTLAAGSVITSATENTTSLKDSKGILPTNVKLESKKVTNKTVINQVTSLVKIALQRVDNTNKEAKDIVVYELNLFDGNTEIHQLADKVEVTINLPFTLAENEEILVYRVDGEKLIQCTSRVSGGKLIFETDHFSTFAFVKVESNTTTSTLSTGDQAPILKLLLILLGSIVVIGIVIISNKKARNL